MKVEECPNCCSSVLIEAIGPGRKTRQECEYCDWCGEYYIPEQLQIKTTKTINISRFGGFEYHVFDKYGGIVVYSQTFYTFEEAEKAVKRELEYSKDKEGGPYTAILWPATVVVEGKVYKVDGDNNENSN